MHQLMREISEYLGEEIDCYRELLEVVEKEKEILLHGSHDDLLTTSDQKMQLSQRLAKAQAGRRQIMEHVGGPDGAPAKLIDMSRYLAKDERPEFREAVKKAARLSKHLAAQNQLNKTYVEEALNTVEHMIGILTGRGRGNAYGRQGRMEGARLPRLMAREV